MLRCLLRVATFSGVDGFPLFQRAPVATHFLGARSSLVYLLNAVTFCSWTRMSCIVVVERVRSSANPVRSYDSLIGLVFVGCVAVSE